MKKGNLIKSLIPGMHVHPIVFISSLMINILGLTLPVVMLQVYDRILGHHSVSTALLLFTAALIAVTIDGVMRYLRGILLQILGEPYALQAPVRLADKLLSSSMPYNPVNIINAFSHLNTMKNHYSGQSIVALLDLPFVFLYLYVLWFLAGNVVLIPLCLLAIAVVATLVLSTHARKLTLATDRSETSRWGSCYNYFFHKTTYLNHNLNLAENTTLNLITSQHTANTVRQARLECLLSSLIQALSQLSTIAVISFGAYKVIQGELTTGALAACSILAGRCVTPVGALLNTGVRLQAKTIAGQALRTLDQTDSIPETRVRSVKIHNQPVTDHGVYLIQSLDDLTYEDKDTSEEGKRIVTIGTHCPLFAGTVLENLTGYRSEAASEALEVAGQLMLHEYFNKLPRGYESPVSTDSYDEYDDSIKTLITVVRAVVTRPDFIIIDNILSHLDPAAQLRLISFIYSRMDTTFIIHDTLMPDRERFLRAQQAREEAQKEQNKALMEAMEAAHV